MLVTLSRLGTLLLEVAEPLFGGPPTKATVDKTVKEVEGQADPKDPAAVDNSPIEVAAVVSTSQVVRLDASPALRWDGAASAWTCVEDTTVQVSFADGTEQAYHYTEGTAIRVAAGMIQFPKCDDESC